MIGDLSPLPRTYKIVHVSPLSVPFVSWPCRCWAWQWQDRRVLVPCWSYFALDVVHTTGPPFALHDHCDHWSSLPILDVHESRGGSRWRTHRTSSRRCGSRPWGDCIAVTIGGGVPRGRSVRWWHRKRLLSARRGRGHWVGRWCPVPGSGHVQRLWHLPAGPRVRMGVLFSLLAICFMCHERGSISLSFSYPLSWYR